MLCPHCGNRMFDDGLDDLLYCGACGNYEKKGRQVSPVVFRSDSEIIADYNRSRDAQAEAETVARQLAETATEKRARASRLVETLVKDLLLHAIVVRGES